MLSETPSISPLTYLVRQGQAQLDLVGGNISVSAALDGAESVESRAGGASDTEGVHYGGAVGWERCVGCGSDGGITRAVVAKSCQ